MKNKPFSLLDKKFKLIYLIDLLTIVILIIVFQTLIQGSISSFMEKGRVFVIAERYELFFERLTRLSIQAAETPSSRLIFETRDVLNEWTILLQKLELFSREMDIKSDEKEKLQKLMQKIRIKHDSISEAIQKLNLNATPDQQSKLISILLLHENEITTMMEDLILEWKNLTNEGIQKLRTTELFITSVLLVLLCCESLYIFRPLFRSLKEQSQNLLIARDEINELKREIGILQQEINHSEDVKNDLMLKLESSEKALRNKYS